MIEPELEVVWSGTLDRAGTVPCLVPDRITKTTGFWTAPPRIYNKKSAYWTTPRPKVDKAENEAQDEQNEATFLRDGSPDADVELDD